MRKRNKISFGILAASAFLGMLALPAVAATQNSAVCTDAQTGQASVCQACTDCTVVREINDPHTGQHWILMRDPTHPGGPGVLVAEESLPYDRGLRGAIKQLHPVIRAGDRVTVEESSAKFDLKLGGIALYPAAQGAPLKVRLEITGRVVPAAALGPGRTLLIPEKEFRP